LVQLTLDMRGKVVGLGELPSGLAIVRGPIVLSRETRLPGPAIEAIIKPLADKEGFILLDPVADKDPNMWMKFEASFIPESYKEGGSQPIKIMLCDYASAGNTNDGYPFFKVWLPQLIDPRIIQD
jgi:uncharacterized protein